jgi:TPR repeat protein
MFVNDSDFNLSQENDAAPDFHLGVLHFFGDAGEINHKEAFLSFEKAAKKGHGPALFALGLMRGLGLFVEKDLSLALSYFKEARNAGVPEAKGKLLAEGGLAEGGLAEGGLEEALSGESLSELKGALRRYGAVPPADNPRFQINPDYSPPRLRSKELFRYQFAEKDEEGGKDSASPTASSGKEAVDTLRRLYLDAEKGIGRAQFELAKRHAFGEGAEKDLFLAFKWMSRAASKGEPIAAFNLASMWEEGIGTPKNLKKAAELYEISASKGFPLASHNLARLYYQGTGVQRDLKESFRLFSEAAKRDLSESRYQLANMLMRGEGTKIDKAEAIRQYLKAADEGHPEALFRLGLAYNFGVDAPKDQRAAKDFFQRAADLGNVEALFNLGKLSLIGGNGFPKNEKLAFRNILSAAEARHPMAQYDAGRMCEEGLGTPVDKKAALKWYLLAAERKDPKALLRAARLYDQGEGTKEDPLKAFEYYKLAADAGHPLALLEMGLMLLKGRGVNKDKEEALKHFLKAAENSVPQAFYRLGFLREEDDGPEGESGNAQAPESQAPGAQAPGAQSQKEKLEGEWDKSLESKNAFKELKSLSAFDYYLKGAILNDHGSQFKVSLFLEKGAKVPKDLTASMYWLRKAAEGGLPEAEDKIASVFLFGLSGTERDQEEGLRFLRSAAEKDYAPSLFLLGKFYLSGELALIKKSKTMAARLMREASRKGELRALNVLAKMLFEGDGIPKNTEEAIRLFTEAADGGDKAASEKLAYLHYYGKVPGNDRAEAFRRCSLAAKDGSPQALFFLGGMLEKGDGTERDLFSALRHYEEAALLKHPLAIEKLSKINPARLEEILNDAQAREKAQAQETQTQTQTQTQTPESLSGSSEIKDADRLSRLLYYAEKYRDKKVFHRLGKVYETGKWGTPHNFEIAFQWYKKAADQGYGLAQLKLGDMLNFGRGVEMNKKEAARMYLLAAEQGVGQAQFLLGKMYDSGDGVEQDKKTAFKWYHRAAENNDRDAQYILGFKYYNGDGVAPDKAMALKYFCLSHYFGHKTADYAIRTLYRREGLAKPA